MHRRNPRYWSTEYQTIKVQQIPPSSPSHTMRAVLLSTLRRADGSVERVFGAPPGSAAGAGFTCPTGEPCESPKVCKCKGVAADGTVGVGASCECVTIQRVPPGPHRPGRLPPGMRTVPVQQPVVMLNPVPFNDSNSWEARWHRFLRRPR